MFLTKPNPTLPNPSWYRQDAIVHDEHFFWTHLTWHHIGINLNSVQNCTEVVWTGFALVSVVLSHLSIYLPIYHLSIHFFLFSNVCQYFPFFLPSAMLFFIFLSNSLTHTFKRSIISLTSRRNSQRDMQKEKKLKQTLVDPWCLTFVSLARLFACSLFSFRRLSLQLSNSSLGRVQLITVDN